MQSNKQETATWHDKETIRGHSVRAQVAAVVAAAAGAHDSNQKDDYLNWLSRPFFDTPSQKNALLSYMTRQFKKTSFMSLSQSGDDEWMVTMMRLRMFAKTEIASVFFLWPLQSALGHPHLHMLSQPCNVMMIGLISRPFKLFERPLEPYYWGLEGTPFEHRAVSHQFPSGQSG